MIAISSAETYRALQTRTSDLQESLEYQTAISDVLKVIGGSTLDLQPVFDTIVTTAARLCEAGYANITTRESDGFRVVAGYSNLPDKPFAGIGRSFPIDRNSITGRTVLAQQFVHLVDVTLDPEYALLESARRTGMRSILGVPLIRDGVVVGTLNLGRVQVRPFTGRQIDLIRTFADQAVIAMENARLLRELRQRTADLQESLEYQTATSDVLKVISRSTFDLQPVLDTVVETAARLCEADQAVIARREGELARLAANYGFPPEYEAAVKALGAFPVDRNSPLAAVRAMIEGRPVHIHDVAAVPGYTEISIRLGKQRTTLGVPLLREGEPIGVILLARQRVEPFTDRQIELVSTFADQAVIAIENTRLITEQREALEQQTATAEVLQVINALPANLRRCSMRYWRGRCGCAERRSGRLATYDGEYSAFTAASWLPRRTMMRLPFPPVRPSPAGSRRLIERRFARPVIRYAGGFQPRPEGLFFAQKSNATGLRTALMIPLRKGWCIRRPDQRVSRPEARPFAERENHPVGKLCSPGGDRDGERSAAE